MRHLLLVLMIGLSLLFTACQSQNDETPLSTAIPTSVTRVINTVTPIPTVVIVEPTETATITPTFTATVTSTNTLVPTNTVTPTIPTTMPMNTPEPSMTPIASETPIQEAISSLERIDHYWFERPIAQEEGKTHWIDRTYPYGSTQLGAREVHLGVEFVNTRFTPILAVGDGLVLFAGEDSEQQFGPELNYYGNVVVIQHNGASPEGLPVYTLYGHMHDIEVQSGERVSTGDRLGRVGDSGIAIGSHLHFEVRVGSPYDFRATRNPDLWIKPYIRYGTLAGRVYDAENPYNVVLRLRGDDFDRETYTYASEGVNSDAVWDENFALGDVPQGTYELLISNEFGRILFRQQVMIESGKTTFVDVAMNAGG